MPLPIAPLIMAGASLVGGAANQLSQGSMNRRSRRFSSQQYNRERSDNLEFWRMQNSYNSPTAQVSRLKSAGLNPALMYGGSASGASGMAGSLSAPSAQSPDFKSSNPGDSIAGAGLAFMNAMYDLDIKQAQANNLKAQNNVILQDAALRAAQVENSQASTDRSRFDLGLASELRATSAEAARENLRQMKVNTRVTLNDDERKAAMNSSNLREAAQRVLNLREQRSNTVAQRDQIRSAIRSLNNDSTLKEFDIELRRLGVAPNTPWWGHMVGRLISNLLDGLGQSDGSDLMNLISPFKSNKLKSAFKHKYR